MTSKRKPLVRELLAEKLLAWGQKHELLTDPYLSRVSRALMENSNLARWSETDPLDLLPHPKSAHGARMLRLLSTLTILRNVLVFTPVALTWAAVSQSSRYFAIYVAKDQNSVANFLQFWQNGYGVLPPFWKISQVADLDVILILLVIISTFLISYLTVRIGRVRDQEESEFEQERTSIALDLGDFLFTQRKVTTATLASSVSNSIQNLRGSTADLRNVTQGIKKRINP